MNNFAQGNKLKLLFTTKKGTASIQDLFDLPESSLKHMANVLNHDLKQPDDLFAIVSTADSMNKLRLDIIMEVINIRVEEKSSKISAQEISQERAGIRELINKKKLAAKGDLSIEELEKMDSELADKTQ